MSDDPDLGYRVLRSIRQILRRVSSYSRSLHRDTGLSVPTLLCLRAIHEDTSDEVTVARVADVTHLSRSTVSTLAEKLVQANLVTRERSGRDRRRVHLELTDAGRARISELPQPLEDRFLERLRGMPQPRREAVLEVLEEVVRMMDADEVDAAPMLVPDAVIKPDSS